MIPPSENFPPATPPRTLPARRGRGQVYAVFPPFADPVAPRRGPRLTPGQVAGACVTGLAIGAGIMLVICAAL